MKRLIPLTIICLCLGFLSMVQFQPTVSKAEEETAFSVVQPAVEPLAGEVVAAEEATVTPVTEPTQPLDLNIDQIPVGDLINKLPEVKQGLIYSVDNYNIQYASTVALLEWEGITLEAGYAVPDTVLGVISYRVGGLSDLGIKVPVLDLLECNVGYYVGSKNVGLGNSPEFDHGLSLTLLKLKF